MHHPTHIVQQWCDICASWPDWARFLSLQLNKIEELMTEMNSDQQKLNDDVAALKDAVGQLDTNLTNQIASLKAQIAANPGQPAGALDLSGLDSLVASTKALADGSAPVPDATAPDALTSVVVDPTAQGPGSVSDEYPASPTTPTG